MENQMSLIEIALEIMEKTTEPIDIYTLIEETLAKKGIIDTDGTYMAKLYTDIIASSKFVFMGDNKWDLKDRQPLEQFDKDGSSFNSKEDYESAEEDEDDEIGFDDDEDEDDNRDEDEDEDDEDSARFDDEDEEDEEYDDSIGFDDEEDEDDSYDDNDEEKYNKYMDDYEDLYED